MANITRFDPLSELTRLEPFSDFDNLFKASWCARCFRAQQPLPR
jgi:hypothetical protein